MSANPAEDLVAPPRYQSIVDYLSSLISQGHLNPGDRLPTEMTLVERFGVSRQTVRRAYQEIVSAGQAERIPGRGSFVTGRARGFEHPVTSIDDLLGLRADTVMEVVRPLEQRVSVTAAARLALDDDITYEMLFRRFHRDRPICAVYAYFPPSVGELLARRPETTEGHRSSTTIIGLLDEILDRPVVTAQQSITVAHADEDLAQCLECEVGKALLRIDRTYFGEDGTPQELAISFMDPDLYSHRSTITRNGQARWGVVRRDD